MCLLEDFLQIFRVKNLFNGIIAKVYILECIQLILFSFAAEPISPENAVGSIANVDELDYDHDNTNAEETYDPGKKQILLVNADMFHKFQRTGVVKKGNFEPTKPPNTTIAKSGSSKMIPPYEYYYARNMGIFHPISYYYRPHLDGAYMFGLTP